MDKIRIYAVVGPTASGKTALSVELARRRGGEVVCCDSMQIYSGMRVGTARPDEAETAGVAHHLFGFCDPKTAFSCADYVEAAGEVILDIAARGKLPILCGGTGLYLDALLLGCGDASAAPDEGFRAEMRKIAEDEGSAALYERLVAADPDGARAIHPNNVKRVIRALEICRAAGSKSEYDRRSRPGDMKYDAAVVGIRYGREELYRRIDIRVDKMLADGLCEETAELEREGVFAAGGTAAQAIGYKEILPYIRGQQTLEEATESLKRATRRYAKRQMTWFSGRDYVKWIDAGDIDTPKTFEIIVKSAEELFQLQ